jgi:hypothetical protein
VCHSGRLSAGGRSHRLEARLDSRRNTHLLRYTLSISIHQANGASLLLLAALAAAPSQAQSGAAPHPERFLQPATDTIAVTVETQGRVIPFATAFRSLRRLTRANRSAIELTYQWRGNDGSATADTLWIDARTLAPIENHRHNGLQDGVTIFDGSSAHTRYTAKGKAEQRADTTVAGRLHASGELEDLIRSSPLALGYGAGYTLYYGPPGRLARSATFRVVRSETVTARNGMPVECWVVDAALSEGLNTFFISKSDRRVVRLVNHEDPSAAFVFTK